MRHHWLEVGDYQVDVDGAEEQPRSEEPPILDEESRPPGLSSLVESPLISGSATKLQILDVLSDRRMTAPEVARKLGMDRTGIYRHLEALQSGGYVERQESDRKWVYYDLTKKGAAICALGSNGLLLALVLGGLGLIGYFILNWWTRWQTWKDESGMYDTPEPIPEPAFPIVSVAIVAVVALVLAGANRWLRHRAG